MNQAFSYYYGTLLIFILSSVKLELSWNMIMSNLSDCNKVFISKNYPFKFYRETN